MRRAWLQEYALATVEAAKRLSIPLLDHWSAWKSAAGNMVQLLDGGFHPNEYGHRLIAETLFQCYGMWDPDGSWICRHFIPA